MTDQRNATSSWSGYSHQGKLGIFVALQKINKLLEKEENIDDWKVIYENAEDFDIQCNGIVKSRHQVKAYKDAKYPNDIKDVLATQEYKLDERGNKKLKQKGFQICSFDEQCKPLDIEVDEESRYLHVITEINGFDLNKEEFNNKYPHSNFVLNPNKIKLFRYPEENGQQKCYCPLSTDDDTLKEFCTAEIEKILQKNQHVEKDNKSYHSGMFDGLQYLLDEEIRKKHSSGGYPELKFNKIHDYITSNNDFEKSSIVRFKRTFLNTYQQYKIELDEGCIDFSEYEKEADKILEEIHQVEDDEFRKFLANIHIDKTKFDSNRNINEDGLKEVFFFCLFNYKKFDRFNISFRSSQQLTFVLTTINSNSKYLAKSITENPNITKTLFEKNHIINLHQSEKLINMITRMKRFTEYKKEQNDNNWELMDRYVSDNDIFLHPKDIKLVSIEDLENKGLDKVTND